MKLTSQAAFFENTANGRLQKTTAGKKEDSPHRY